LVVSRAIQFLEREKIMANTKKKTAKSATKAKTTTKKKVVKKVPAKKAVTKKKTAAKKAAPIKKKVVPAKKSASTKKKTVTKKAVAKKAVAKKKTTPIKKNATSVKKKTATKKKAVTKKAVPAKKTPVKKTTAAKKASKNKTSVKKAPAEKIATKKKTPDKKKTVKKAPTMTKKMESITRRPVVMPRTIPGKRKKITAKDKRELKKNLQAMSKQFVDKIEHLKQNSLVRNDSVVSPEDGTDVFDRQFNLSLASAEQKSLSAIYDALKRLEEGTYGKCDTCGDIIGTARLKALPFVKMCINCKSDFEKDRARPRVY
jgi:RNA polymerase-binding protein DksA